MTETERWVNETCGRIMASGHVRLYRDLYKDLRESLPCRESCRLIEAGLDATRGRGNVTDPCVTGCLMSERARAMAALTRLARWAWLRDAPRCRRCGLAYSSVQPPDCRGGTCQARGASDGS